MANNIEHLLLLGKGIETASWLVNPIPAVKGSSRHPPLCPWNVGSTCFPLPELPEGHSLEIMIWCWDHLDCTCDWTQLRPLHKLLGSWWASANIYCLAAAQEKPCMQVSLLIKPANLEWPPSFISLSLPSTCRHWFQIKSGKLVGSMWTNIHRLIYLPYYLWWNVCWCLLLIFY